MKDANWSINGQCLEYKNHKWLTFPFTVYVNGGQDNVLFQTPQEFIDSLQESNDDAPGNEVKASCAATRRVIELKMAGFTANEIIEMTNARVV